MLIILLDEPGLFVFDTAADAQKDIEAIDAASEIRAAFDDLGVPYRVDWLRPNRNRKAFFGFAHSIDPGVYRFVPAGPPDPAALARLLEEHPKFTNPPEAEAALVSLLSR